MRDGERIYKAAAQRQQPACLVNLDPD